MPTVVVINKALAALQNPVKGPDDPDNEARVFRYESDIPVEWNGMEFTTHDHVVLPEVPVVSVNPPIDPSRWRIYVGSFFDRFGQAKLTILADPDPLVQAAIKDATVRKHIDLIARRTELMQVIGLLISKGHAVDPVAILDVEPNDEEIWRG